jgi:hypothetical protein
MTKNFVIRSTDRVHANAKPIPDAGYLAECFVYECGGLTWKKRPLSHFKNARTHAMWNAKFAFKKAGREMAKGGYRQVGLDCLRYLEHRIIAVMNGVSVDGVIDHRDGNGGNNRIENLRPATQMQNCMNNSGWKKRSLPRGVYQTKSGRYMASIRINGKAAYLGRFDTIEDAAKARLSAESAHFGRFSFSESRIEENG